MYECTYVCMNVRMYLCMYVRMYVCMNVRMYVCMYECTYVCMSPKLTMLVLRNPYQHIVGKKPSG